MHDKPQYLARRKPLPEIDRYTLDCISGEDASDDAVLTIAIPTFRRPQLLREAISSAMHQETQRNYVVIVIDNESNPDVAAQVDAVVNEFDRHRISLYRNRENVGMFGNWNRCLGLAKTPWITLLNDDDLLHPGFVGEVCRMIDSDGSADLVQTGYILMDRRPAVDTKAIPNSDILNVSTLTRPVKWINLVLSNSRVGSLGIAYRTCLAREIGGFDQREYPTADYCFNARMLLAARSALEIDAQLASYRIEANESLRPETLQAFVQNDYFMRIEASRLVSFGRLLRLYARLCTVGHVRSLERVWKLPIDRRVLEMSMGLNFPRGKAVQLGYRIAAAATGLLIRKLA
jgi:glycosyltransferase involved in cell wall biosynthesis